MNIRFVDLPRQNKLLKGQVLPVVEKVIADADFSLGPRLSQFEKHFAAFCNKKYAIGLNSGTDALLLSLIAYGVGPGDEVITVPNSYFSTAMVISNIGAKPIFVDIEPDFYTIDVAKIEKAITNKTKAIIPVHLYGQPADMTPILKLAKKYKLAVIEDACQAHGALYNKITVPVGETGAFSFYPGKNLGSYGDGGAVVTSNKVLAEKLLLLRNDGSLKKYVHRMLGVKSRLHTIQAAILDVKLPHSRRWNDLRRRHAKKYLTLLKGIPEVRTPQEAEYATHIYHIYAIECERRDALQKYLKEKGVETIIHYPIPIHLQEAYASEKYQKGDFPITEKKASKLLSLPMFPELYDKEIEYVCNVIMRFYSKASS